MTHSTLILVGYAVGVPCMALHALRDMQRHPAYRTMRKDGAATVAAWALFVASIWPLALALEGVWRLRPTIKREEGSIVIAWRRVLLRVEPVVGGMKAVGGGALVLMSEAISLEVEIIWWCASIAIRTSSKGTDHDQ